MRYIVRLICRALIRERTWQQPRRHESIQIGGWNTDKKKALSAAEVRGLIEGFPEAKVMHVVDGDTVIVASGWSGWIQSIARKTVNIGETPPHMDL